MVRGRNPCGGHECKVNKSEKCCSMLALQLTQLCSRHARQSRAPSSERWERRWGIRRRLLPRKEKVYGNRRPHPKENAAYTVRCKVSHSHALRSVAPMLSVTDSRNVDKCEYSVLSCRFYQSSAILVLGSQLLAVIPVLNPLGPGPAPSGPFLPRLPSSVALSRLSSKAPR